MNLLKKIKSWFIIKAKKAKENLKALGWLRGVALTYIGLLWLPFTPEKLITIPLAFYIQKVLFITLPRKLKLVKVKRYKYSCLF